MNTLEWLTQLVQFDTTSHRSNLALITSVDEWFQKHHIATRLTYDVTKQKANLFATISARDGRMEGGLILSGHTDVVPVDGQSWDTNPFEAVIKDERVYGRGTCDMKGFLAVILALAPVWAKQTLSHPIHFAFSYDEETGCRGAPLLIADMQKAGIKPAACIVGEPTSMCPVIAHKGIQVFRVRVKGKAGHSSLTPKGCNAIEYASRLISFIRHFADEIRREGPFDNHFDVPFTSISTNSIHGGIAHNVIPESCEFFFEFRHLPSVKPQMIIDAISNHIKNELQPMMQREYADASIEMEKIGAAPSFESHEDEAIYQLACAMSGEKDIRKVAYATEAGLFQHADVSTIICGPGSIEQAHRANEYVDIDQLRRCEEFLKKMVEKIG